MAFRIALHCLGLAQHVDGGLAVPSTVGPIIDAIAEHVDDVHVVAYGGSGAPSHAHVVRAPNVSLTDLGPIGSWRTMLSRRRRVADITSRVSGDWDVLILWLSNRRVNEILAANRCPRVVCVDLNGERRELQVSDIPFRRKFRAWGTVFLTEHRSRQAGAHAGLVIVNGAILEPRYAKVAKDIRVIRPAKHRRWQTYRADDRLSGSAELLFVGRILRSKGAFDALEGFALAKRSVLPAGHLHIAGTGDEMDAFRRRVSELGVEDSVTFHGWVEGQALFDLYRRCDVLLHPSYSEVFPRAVLEALAHSVLTLCTPVGAIPERLADGDEVIYIESGAPSSIATGLARLVNDPALRRRLIERGFAAAEESSADAFAERTLEAIVSRWPELDAARRGGTA